MPCDLAELRDCVRKVLLSTGLVGSWFLSCASISVRKSVPPRVVPVVANAPLPLDEVLELPPCGVRRRVVLAAAEFALLICMISL